MNVNAKHETHQALPALSCCLATARTGRADDAMVSSSTIKQLTRLAGVSLILIALGIPPGAFSADLPAGQSVTLAWTGTDPNIAGCNVYYGVASRVYTQMVNPGASTSVTIAGLIEGTTYFFAATSYNNFGLESDYSVEASYTVPGVLAPILNILRSLANGQVMLSVAGQAGRTYNIQASADFITWTGIGSVLMPAGGSLVFTDPNAVNFTKRFYRAQYTN